MLRGFIYVLAGIVLGITLFRVWWNANFFSGYDPKLALLAEVVEKQNKPGHVREKVVFQGKKGMKVPALLHMPEGEGPFPCLVLLYGIGQDMDFADEIAEAYVQAGYALFCPEQLGRGERKNEVPREGLKALTSFKDRLSSTVVEARRAVDYLSSRADIDSSNLTLWGVSLGAILGSSALAMEPRYRQGLLMWGGGDVTGMMTRNRLVRDNASRGQRFLAFLGAWFLAPAEPLLRIDQIAPRPLLFQNALQDEIIPRACTEAYYNKAGEPKEILWYDCGHEKGLSLELIQKIIQDQIAWLKRVGEGKQAT